MSFCDVVRGARPHRQKRLPLNHAEAIALNRVKIGSMEARAKAHLQQLSVENNERAQLESHINSRASAQPDNRQAELMTRIREYCRQRAKFQEERAAAQRRIDEERESHHTELLKFQTFEEITNQNYEASQKNASGLRNELTLTRKDIQQLREQRETLLQQASSVSSAAPERLRICNDSLSRCQKDLDEIVMELSESREQTLRLAYDRSTAQENLSVMRETAMWWENLAAAAAGLVVTLSGGMDINDVKTQLDDKRKVFTVFSELVVAGQTEVERLEKELAAIARGTSHDEARRELTAQVMAAKEQQRLIESYLKSLEHDLNQALVALKSRVASMDEEKSHLETSNAFLTRYLGEKEADLEMLRHEVKEWGALASKVIDSDDKKTMMHVAEKISGDADELARSIETLNAELAASSTQLAVITQSQEDTTNECSKVSNTVKSAAVIALGLLAAGGLLYLGFTIVKSLFGVSGDETFRDPAEIPSLDASTMKVVVENERWWPFPVRKWTKALLPTDRYLYTKADGHSESAAPQDLLLLPNEEWVGEWTVEGCGSEDGWLYAVDFSTAHYTKNFPVACVRRRIHVRKFITISVTKPEAPQRKSELKVGESLCLGEELRSPSGAYNLILQHDGNLVLYYPLANKALWSSKTSGRAAGVLVLQYDGNLVLYDPPQKRALWSSKTSGHIDAQLVLRLQNDGDLVLQSGSRVIWSTGTGTKTL